MRDYSKVSGSFWTGKTGKSIRGQSATQLTALYLMTSPHSNMIGAYYCPLGYIQLDTGLSFEGASKGLKSLIEGYFCTYDNDAEIVFIHEMAKYQIEHTLKPTDLRVKGIQKLYESIPSSLIQSAFFAKYAEPFFLTEIVKIDGILEAPYKPLLSQKQEQEQEQEQENPPVPAQKLLTTTVEANLNNTDLAGVGVYFE